MPCFFKFQWRFILGCLRHASDCIVLREPPVRSIKFEGFFPSITIVLALMLAVGSYSQNSASSPTLEAELAEAQRILQDWTNLSGYGDQNAKLLPPAAAEER